MFVWLFLFTENVVGESVVVIKKLLQLHVSPSNNVNTEFNNINILIFHSRRRIRI